MVGSGIGIALCALLQAALASLGPLRSGHDPCHGRDGFLVLVVEHLILSQPGCDHGYGQDGGSRQGRDYCHSRDQVRTSNYDHQCPSWPGRNGHHGHDLQGRLLQNAS